MEINYGANICHEGDTAVGPRWLVVLVAVAAATCISFSWGGGYKVPLPREGLITWPRELLPMTSNLHLNWLEL